MKKPTVTLYANATGNSGKITNNGDKTAVANVSSTSYRRVGWVDITTGDAATNASWHWVADARMT